MSFKRFKYEDIFYNTIIANPEYDFYILDSKCFLNRGHPEVGSFGNFVRHIPSGHTSLYELNVDRPSGSLIYPFLTKDSTRTSFRTVTVQDFQESADFLFGDTITGSYPLSASISRIFVPAGDEFTTFVGELEIPINSNKKYIKALKTSIEDRQNRSHGFLYGDKGTENVNLICIPAIFYGSSLKKGSIELNSYITGTLAATLKDESADGSLLQTYGPGAGSRAGIVLYEQGIILLTGSWSLDAAADSRQQFFNAQLSSPSWLNYGSGISEVGAPTGYGVIAKCAYSLKFSGTNKIPTLTMLAHADKGDLNYSNNPSFVEKASKKGYSHNSVSLHEIPASIKNIRKSEYGSFNESFENITYISKIGIYDEHKNLIAIASLANPVKKTETRDYTFKMRLDF